MSAQEIKAALNCHAQEFVPFLFPAGKKVGNEWLVGSLAGEPGKSLAIRVGSDKVGIWSDFATNDKGSNLLELYMQARQVECGEAIKQCAEWLGGPIVAPCVKVGGSIKSEAAKALPCAFYSPTEHECRQVMRMIARCATTTSFGSDARQSEGGTLKRSASSH